MQIKSNYFKVIGLFLLSIMVSACATSTKVLPPPMTLKYDLYGHAAVNDGEKIYVLNGSKSGGGMEFAKLSGDIEIIDPKTRTSELIEDILIPRRYGSAIHDGDRSIYIFGGISLQKNGRSSFESRVEVFDTVMKKVRFAKSMPQPVRFVTSVFKDKKIFVFGGQKSGGVLRMSNVASYYDLEKEEWFKLPNMPFAMQSNAALRDDAVYLVGGYARGTKFSTFYKLDLQSNQWHKLPSLPAATSANKVIMSAKNNYELYSFGDYDELDQVIKFDFLTNQWTEVNIDFKPVRHAAITEMNGVIYVIGGTTSTKNGAKNYIQEFRL